MMFCLAFSCYGNPSEKPCKSPAETQPKKSLEKTSGNIKAERILFLGNSLTSHGPLAAVDWSGNWGMAASSREKDYVHILARSLSELTGTTPKVMIENLGDFEQKYETYDVNKRLKKCFEFKADLVIVAIGENVPVLNSEKSKTLFRNSMRKLLNALKSNSKPVIVVRSCFWPDNIKDKILKQTCKEIDGIFVDISNLSEDESNYARSEREYTHKGVAAHPGDKGMQAIAAAIFDKIKKKSEMPLNIEKLFDAIRTPKKSNELLISPSYKKGEFDSHAVDCPFPFYHDGSYWMTYVGWDGAGYQTGLARSDDLLTWKKEGLIMGRGPKNSVTEFNVALTCIMRDNELFGNGTLKKVDGRFVGTYHAYPKPGYEAGPAVIGLCYSKNLRTWDVGDPILKPDPKCAWEAGGLYKSWLLESDGTYYLFYNAKNKTDKSVPWIEQTGVAISTDLVNWKRHPDNPVLLVGSKGDFDDIFASDPCVFRHNDMWVMFYFGNCSDGHARDGAAFSNDLIHWQKGNEILVDIGPVGSIDSRHAHKPGIISKDGRLHHFYCAAAPATNKCLGEIEHSEVRGIACSRSVEDAP